VTCPTGTSRSSATTIQDSNQKSFEIRILGGQELFRVTLEINFALAKNQEASDDRVGGFLRGIANDAPGGGIEAEIGESKTILQSMGGKERGDAVDIAQAKNESDDGLRSDGVESSGGGIVQNNFGMVDESASDGDATTHAAGEFRRKHVDGVIEFDELENFLDARLDFFFGETIFGQAKGHVFADGQGIEESAFLKNETDPATKIIEILLGGVGDAKAENVNITAIGTHQADGEFESERLTGAGFAKEDKGFAMLGGERDSAKDVAFSEAEMNVMKIDDGLTGSERGWSGR
jgi:hypothetical protein